MERNSFDAPHALWNIPIRRNPFFTGRQDALERLHKSFTARSSASLGQLQVIHGLGGNLQTANRREIYAYRHRNEFFAVFWVECSSEQDLLRSFHDIARLLNLQEEFQQRASRRCLTPLV